MSDRQCLQCGESEGAVKAFQRAKDPIYCAIVDYFGECEYDWDRHRFRDWSDKELTEGWKVKPEFTPLYRRITNAYQIKDEHREENR